MTRGGNEHQTSTATWTVTGAADHGASASDFVGNALPSGTVTFLPGETSKLITVNVAGDGTYEGNKNKGNGPLNEHWAAIMVHLSAGGN